MNIAFEYWIILGLVGLYFYDSAKLIQYNQLFFVQGIGRKFFFDIPSKQTNILKQYLFLSHPLHCYHALFLATWHIVDKRTVLNIENELSLLHHKAQILKKLYLSQILVWLLTLIIFPFVFLTSQNYIVIFSVLASIYLINILQFIYVLLKRKQLHLTRNLCFTLFTDAIFCPPFALNLIKKISLAHSLNYDAIQIGQHLLKPQDFEKFLNAILLEIEYLQEVEPNLETLKYQQLSKRHSELTRLKMNID